VRLGDHLLGLVAIEFRQAGVELDGEPVSADPSGPMPTRAVTEAPLAGSFIRRAASRTAFSKHAA
jgi:hypothetical protein